MLQQQILIFFSNDYFKMTIMTTFMKELDSKMPLPCHFFRAPELEPGLLSSQVHIETLMSVFTTRYIGFLRLQTLLEKLTIYIKSILPSTSNTKIIKLKDGLL